MNNPIACLELHNQSLKLELKQKFTSASDNYIKSLKNMIDEYDKAISILNERILASSDICPKCNGEGGWNDENGIEDCFQCNATGQI